MVFHGFWLVSMVFQVGFMVFHGFWLISMVFQGGFMVLWFLVGFHGYSRWFHGFSLFLVGFNSFSLKCTRPHCILAQQSSLGLPPGFGPNDDVADDGGDDDDNDSGNDDDDDNKSKHSARDWAGPPRDVGSYRLEQKLKIDPSRP